jgi:hypothetical protein
VSAVRESQASVLPSADIVSAEPERVRVVFVATLTTV